MRAITAIIIGFIFIILLIIFISKHREFSDKIINLHDEVNTAVKNNGKYCGNVPSDMPQAFGPILWKAFHTIAHNYPDNAKPETSAQCQAFITSLSLMIPCSHCGYHFKKFISENEKNNGNLTKSCSGVCQGLPEVCSTKTNIIDFFLRAHNNVSSHVHPEREPFTLEQADAEYSTFNMCVYNDNWFEGELSRNLTQ
jgi:hypothetical protein